MIPQWFKYQRDVSKILTVVAVHPRSTRLGLKVFGHLLLIGRAKWENLLLI